MRPLPRRIPALAASALAAVVFTTGCSEIQQASDTVDKVQACAQATKIAAELSSKITTLTDDPAAMEKALNDAASKLDAAAAKAGDTTLNEALTGLADTYQKLDITDVNSAVDGAQKVVTDTAKYLQDIGTACS